MLKNAQHQLQCIVDDNVQQWHTSCEVAGGTAMEAI
jgi:hypothetical protein